MLLMAIFRELLVHGIIKLKLKGCVIKVHLVAVLFLCRLFLI